MIPKKKMAWIKVKSKEGRTIYINVSHIMDFFNSRNLTYIDLINKQSPIICNGDITPKLAEIISKSVVYSMYEVQEEKNDRPERKDD